MTIDLGSMIVTRTITGGPGNPRDWIGVFKVNAPNDQYIDWVYLANGRRSPRPTVGKTHGTVTLNINVVDKNGLYEIRFLAATGAATGVTTYILIEKSDAFGIVVKIPIGVAFTAPDGISPNPNGSWDVAVPDDMTVNVRP